MSRKFWDKQAEKHDSNVNAVNFDIMANELELFYLDRYIGGPANLIDLGCGNGDTLFYLAKRHPSTEFVGIDFSQNMIDIANRQKELEKLTNVNFVCKDITKDLSEYKNTFNIALSKRLFINLPSSIHKKVINNIYSIVNPWFGKLFLIECFIEPLDRINIIRKSLGLSDIVVHDFNEYLSIGFFNEIKEWFVVNQKIDFNSFFYFISRVFNDGGSYTSRINKLATKLSKENRFMGGFSPEIMFIMNLAEPVVWGTCDCLEEVIKVKTKVI